MKFIDPAIEQAGWNLQTQVRRELTFTDGKVIVRGKLWKRGKKKRADYVLFWKKNVPLAVIEAKDNKHSVGAGMQQALGYAECLDVPFVFSSNGDGFLFHDRTGLGKKTETTLAMDAFPAPEFLWERYCKSKGLKSAPSAGVVTEPYYEDPSGKEPRYYQRVAINRTLEAIARGQKRLLLVMATGTGKTYTAFQIIWRLWKGGYKKRILFLADRNILIDQTKTNDFKPFGAAMTKVRNRQVDKSYEIYLALYQAVSGTEEEANIYKQFSRDFFDLIVVDECHRSSAREASAWHEILTYFDSATHLGLTATPKETKDVSNITYFGDPVYTYSLKQGIEDGFLAPYKVIRVDIDRDLAGWRPEKGAVDDLGTEIEDRIYNQRDFDKILVLNQRTKLVAEKVVEQLESNDPYAKTIIFCEDIDTEQAAASFHKGRDGMKELFLAWQDPVNRGWYPVGKLTADEDDNYEFVYTQGALASERFRPLGQMQDLHKRYRSDELFPLFANRLLSRKRPEYKKLLQWINLAKDEDHPIQVLALTEGVRRTDTLTVFPHPVPEKDGTFRIHFFSHGIRYLQPEALDLIGNLKQGAPLFLQPDAQNESDEYALLLQTGSPATSVGYCPRYLARDLQQIMASSDFSGEIQLYVEQVNKDAPLQLRLLCTVEAPWPDDFKPCTSEHYTPLA